MNSSPENAERLTIAGKNAVRHHVWALLDARGVVRPPGSAGHIPSFVSAEAAADQLMRLPVWMASHVVKANPDQAQLPVRLRALTAGKVVYMAVPRLETVEPFYLLDPERLAPGIPLSHLATGQGAAAVAPRVETEQMLPIDVIVCGSVAVDRRGARVGKGAGYSDIEVALLSEAGLITPETVIITTVHDLQIVEESIPETPHDFRVDYIATPTQLLECPRADRPPPRIRWDQLSPGQLQAMPALAQLRHSHQE